MAGLNPKRKAWLEEYLQCWNASEAARRVGYAHPNRQGSRLLSNVDVQNAISERLSEKCMSAEEVLVRLAEMARADIRDFIYFREDGSWNVDWDAAQGKTHLVKTAKQTKDGLTLELYDAQAALEKIGRAHGLFSDRHEVSGPGGGPIEISGMTDDERIAAIMEIVDRNRPSETSEPSN